MMAKDIEQVVFAALQRHGLSRSLCGEAARAVRAAFEDALKGGQAWCPGCKQVAPVEQMHTRCTLCAAGDTERTRQNALEDSGDAEDAAKYRAAIERAKDANALARVYHEGQTDGSHRVALMDVATHVLGLDGATAPETLDKARVVEVLTRRGALHQPSADDHERGYEAAVRDIASDLGLTLDAPTGGTREAKQTPDNKCHADSDGDCTWEKCPQNNPATRVSWCPLASDPAETDL